MFMTNDTREFQKALAEISNYIYVNDGVLKDRVFSDVVRLIALKLRAEDHGDPGLLDPSGLLEVPELEADRWARQLIQFGVDEGLETSDKAHWNIKESSLLWAARHLSRFSFKDFPADVKGEAFQALVVNNLRGDRGEYFTPQPLVSAISKIANLSSDSRVIDPACGSGGFLYGAYRAGVQAANLFGIELSDDVGKAAKLRVQVLGGDPGQVLIGDAFRINRESIGSFDSVLMNPPFGSRTKITDPKVLENFELPNINRGTSGQKALAPELLFLELAMKLLKAEGVMATVIPDGVLQNSSSRFVRDWLSRVAHLDVVISCPSVTFQPYGTGVKTSLLVMTKKSPKGNRSTYLAVSKSVGYDARGKEKTLVSENSSNEKSFELDEDLSVISDEARLHVANQKQVLKFGKSHSHVSTESRWDAEFFSDEERKMIEDFRSLGYLELSEVAVLSTSRFIADSQGAEVGYIALSDVDALTSQVVHVQRMSSQQLPSRATFSVNPGDVITATAGASTGTRKHVTAIISDQTKDCVVSSGFAVLRPKAVSSLQLLGFLRSDLFLWQIMRLRTGHAIPAVADKDLQKVLVPPLADPIWKKWQNSMSKLNVLAHELVTFAESTRS
jgi:type I restriction enzyme M protein